MIKVKMLDIVKDSDLMETEEGDQVFKIIYPLLSNGESVSLSFEGVELVLTPFLNGAIGQLYGKFDRDYVRSHLQLEDVQENLNLFDKWDRVEAVSMEYYSNHDKGNCDTVVNKALES